MKIKIQENRNSEYLLLGDQSLPFLRTEIRRLEERGQKQRQGLEKDRLQLEIVRVDEEEEEAREASV